MKNVTGLVFNDCKHFSTLSSHLLLIVVEMQFMTIHIPQLYNTK